MSAPQKTIDSFKTEFPCITKFFGEGFLKSALEYINCEPYQHCFYNWFVGSPRQDNGLKTLERFFSEPRFHDSLYANQIEDIKSQSKVENQETLIAELYLLASMRMNGMSVKAHDRGNTGPDIIWTNTVEKREIHIEVVTLQYSGPEAKKNREETRGKQNEVDEALKEGAKSTSYYVVHNPIGKDLNDDIIEKIRKVKSGSTQVEKGDAGVLAVNFSYGFDRGYFEPFFIDRHYITPGYIYHAFYGHKGCEIPKQHMEHDFLLERPLPTYMTTKVKSDGKFTRASSKYAGAYIFNPAQDISIYYRNYNSQKPLTTYENLEVLSSLDCHRSPSRWLLTDQPPKLTTVDI